MNDHIENREDNERIARNHFERFGHRGPLIICYRITETSYLVAARPGNGSGHRLHAVVDALDANDKVIDYVASLINNFGFDDLLIRDLEVFEGKVV